MTAIAFSQAKGITVLRFNQQDDGGIIDSHKINDPIE
jgi:hypothetical protein